MLPEWFKKWNRENPTDVFKPAYIIGGTGGAVLVVALLITWGQPFATDAMQTGPRGTGMAVVEYESDLATPDPGIAGITSSAPIVPTGNETLAKDAYEAVAPALAEVTVENYDRLLVAMRAWTGIPDLMENPDHYQTQVAYRMIEMTQNINENWDGHVNANGEVGVTCYTCHRGNAVPSNIWFQVTPVNEATAGWPSVQNRVTPASQYTSLPSDALEKYLLDYETIGVHDLESRVENLPGDPLIQHAERTYSLMNYFANSLGVNCVFCHNSRAFYDPEQVTPQWGTASLGIAMVQELNNDYLVPLGELYPQSRLGPVHEDAPKAACKTCHKGYQQPLQGTNVIKDWPELAATGSPVYK